MDEIKKLTKVMLEENMSTECRTYLIEIIKQLEKQSDSLSNLLAVLHRDGGHYEYKHGTKKSIDDAMKLLHTEWILREHCGEEKSLS